MLHFALGSDGAKPYLELNKHHYTKLLEMYRRSTNAGAQEVDLEKFHAHVWLLLARYKSIRIVGNVVTAMGLKLSASISDAHR
jgi:hypothetical protein